MNQSEISNSRAKAGVPLKYVQDHMFDGCCFPWPFARRGGYALVCHYGERESAHVIVCTFINGPRPSPRHHVRHLCGKGQLGCFNAECLAWGTPSENYADAIRHGTAPKGELCGAAKLEAPSVIEIHSLRGKVAQTIVAKRFGVTQALVSLIQREEIWKHLWVKGIYDMLGET